MDEPSGKGIVPDADDEHSAVMTMLTSESWQKRLDEARKAREALLARRGAAQDQTTRLKSVAPHLSRSPLAGRVPGMPERFQAGPEDSAAEGPEAEEEFPEFFPDADDDPPVMRQAPAARSDPWAHVPPVGPARATEPAPPATGTASAVQPAPLRRPVRIAAGFGLGLAAGIAATSLVWMMTGRIDGFAPRTVGAASSAPAVAPQAPALSPPDAMPPNLRVSAVSRPPAGTFVPGGTASQPALPPDSPDIPKITVLASLSGPSGLPFKPVAPVADAQPMPDLTPIRRPALQASVPEVSFVAAPEPGAMLPISFAHPAPHTAAAFVGTGLPDSAPRIVEPPPGAPQTILADPVADPITSSGPLGLPLAAAGTLPDALASRQVTVMAPESIAEADLTAMVAGLQDAGTRLGGTERVSFKVSKSHVRFYHDGDKSAAEALAARIGGDARDFTTSDINPPEGLIELWLEGSGTTVTAAKPARKAARPQTAKATPKKSKDPTEESVMRNLRDKIVRQLQKGEHL